MCPNWSSGIVSVKGKSKNIEEFCKLFIFDEDVDKEKLNKKFFARSFIHEKFKDFKKNCLGKDEAEFSVDFAWSCWSCMFEGYPTKTKKENPEGFGNCVTLEWAIKKHNVQVEITTEEEGMGFEEHIITENGKPIYNSLDMPIHKCLACGNKQAIPSNSDLDEIECSNCGKTEWKDKLVELVKEKLVKIKDEKGGKRNG